MKVLTRLKGWKDTLCDTHRTSLDISVQDGLALTPARVRQLTEKGIAVSLPAGNGDGLYDSRVDYSIDRVYERGITREELWESSQVAKQNILQARNRKKVVESDKKDK